MPARPSAGAVSFGANEGSPARWQLATNWNAQRRQAEYDRLAALVFPWPGPEIPAT